MQTTIVLTLICGLAAASLCAAEPALMPLWPGKAPGDTQELPPEGDTTKPNGNLVAGKRVMRIGNVSTPTITVFQPPPGKETGTAVIVCPGGGHSILAWDLEGTEVAEWLTSIGVTGIVLKYRVPARVKATNYFAAVQDAQRAVSLVRSLASQWGINSQRIGIAGFSAGGQTAGLTALFRNERLYAPVDKADQTPCRPDFGILIYPAYFVEKESAGLRSEIKVEKDAPPLFFAHAWDDRISPLNSLLLAAELKKQGIVAEVHMYASGGHGFGLRRVESQPCTTWPLACEAWMQKMGWLKK